MNITNASEITKIILAKQNSYSNEIIIIIIIIIIE